MSKTKNPNPGAEWGRQVGCNYFSPLLIWLGIWKTSVAHLLGREGGLNHILSELLFNRIHHLHTQVGEIWHSGYRMALNGPFLRQDMLWTGDDSIICEQFSLVLRFIDDEREIREEFIGYVDCENLKGEEVVKLILDKIARLGLDMNLCRGHCWRPWEHGWIQKWMVGVHLRSVSLSAIFSLLLASLKSSCCWWLQDSNS